MSLNFHCYEYLILFTMTGQEAAVRTLYGTTDWLRIEKGYDRAVCCHSIYLTYMLGTYHKKCQPGSVTSWNQNRQEKHQQPYICR